MAEEPVPRQPVVPVLTDPASPEQHAFRWRILVVLYAGAIAFAALAFTGDGFPMPLLPVPLPLPFSPLAGLAVALLVIAAVVHAGLMREAGLTWTPGRVAVAVLAVLAAGVFVLSLVAPLLMIGLPFFDGSEPEIVTDGQSVPVDLRSLEATAGKWFVVDAQGRGTIRGFTRGSYGGGGDPSEDEPGAPLGEFAIGVIEDAAGVRMVRELNVYYDAKTTFSVDGKEQGPFRDLVGDSGNETGFDRQVADRVVTVRFEKRADKLVALSVDAPKAVNAIDAGMEF